MLLKNNANADRPDALRKTRQASLDKVCEPLENILHSTVTLRKRRGRGCASDCSFAKKRLQYVASAFVSSEIWPATERNKKPLSSVLTAFGTIKLNADELQGMPDVQRCNTCSLPTCHGTMEHQLNVLESAADQIEREVGRLCYDCVREGKVLDPDCQTPSLAAE